MSCFGMKQVNHKAKPWFNRNVHSLMCKQRSLVKKRKALAARGVRIPKRLSNEILNLRTNTKRVMRTRRLLLERLRLEKIERSPSDKFFWSQFSQRIKAGSTTPDVVLNEEGVLVTDPVLRVWKKYVRSSDHISNSKFDDDFARRVN